MVVKRIMQGDSYAIPFVITVNETESTPDMIPDIEVSVGNSDGEKIRRTYTGGTIGYDDTIKRWFFRFSQEETLAMEPGSYNVIARVKFSESESADVVGTIIGRIIVYDSTSKEVI